MISAKYLVRLGAAATLAGMVVLAPASLLDRQVVRLSSGRLQLADAEGTFWNGSARLVCRAVGDNTDCGRFHWRFAPRALLNGEVALEIAGRRPGEEARLVVSPSGWMVTRMHMGLPAALLGTAHEKLAALGLGGRILIDGQDISRESGAFNLTWEMASTRLIPDLILGAYRLDATLDENGMDIAIASLKGPLALDGKGKIGRDGGLTLDMTAKVPTGDAQIGPILATMGQQSGAESFRLRLPLR